MRFATILALGALASLAAPATAQEAQSRPSGWQFTLEPYLMLPSMDGRSSVGPVDVRVSTSPADIFRNLNWGIMGLAELNNGRFGILLDGTYMNLETPRDRLLDSIGGHQGAYSVMALARIDSNAEVYAGARINDIGVRLSATGPLGVARTASRSVTWVDPIVGMRVNLPFSSTTDLTVMADVGGFGAASDITVQAWPSLGFRLSNALRAKLGYRLVYTKYETGEGLSRFTYDVLTYGPTIGMQIRF
jgi:hypothetical protein